MHFISCKLPITFQVRTEKHVSVKIVRKATQTSLGSEIKSKTSSFPALPLVSDHVIQYRTIQYRKILGAPPGLHVKPTTIFMMNLPFFTRLFINFCDLHFMMPCEVRISETDTWMTVATWIHLRLRIKLLDPVKSPRSNHRVIQDDKGLLPCVRRNTSACATWAFCCVTASHFPRSMTRWNSNAYNIVVVHSPLQLARTIYFL